MSQIARPANEAGPHSLLGAELRWICLRSTLEPARKATAHREPANPVALNSLAFKPRRLAA